MNGVFDRKIDVNGYEGSKAWGIQDNVPERFENDKIGGPGTSADYNYKLCSLDAIQQVVDPEFTETIFPWNGSRDQKCLSCGGSLSAIYQEIKKHTARSTTFIESPIADPYQQSQLVFALRMACALGFNFCWDENLPLAFAHMPIEHAWHGGQKRYRDNPRDILPELYDNFKLEGWIMEQISNPSWLCPKMAVIAKLGGGSAANMLLETENKCPIAYMPVDSSGGIHFANLDAGTYSFALMSDGAAPYNQIVSVSQEDTLLGVNGAIALVPIDKYFTFKVRVVDAYGRTVPFAKATIIIEPDSIMFHTLTDSTGIAYASADTGGVYKIRINYYANADSMSGLKGSFGDTVTVELLSVCDIDPKAPAPVSTQLRQNYPNPFNPTTTIEFDLAETQHVDLAIYDVSGRRVRTIISGELRAGRYREIWNGRTDNNTIAAPGIYFYQLRAGQHVQAKKLVLIR
jgi:hypothetical protein